MFIETSFVYVDLIMEQWLVRDKKKDISLSFSLIHTSLPVEDCKNGDYFISLILNGEKL